MVNFVVSDKPEDFDPFRGYSNVKDLRSKITFAPEELAADVADAQTPASKDALLREIGRKDLAPGARRILEQHYQNTFGEAPAPNKGSQISGELKRRPQPVFPLTQETPRFVISNEPESFDPFPQTTQKSQESGGIASDLAKSYGKGAGSLVQGLGWLVGSDTIENLGKDAVDYWSASQTPAMQRAIQNVAESTGFVGKLEAFKDNPAALSDFIVSSMPQLIPGIGSSAVAGRIAGTIAFNAATKAGVAAEKAVEAANQAATKYATLSNMVVQGAQFGGQTGAETEHFLINHGATPEEAKSIAMEAAIKVGAATTLLAGLGAGVQSKAVLGNLTDTGAAGLAKNTGLVAAQMGAQVPVQNAIVYGSESPYDPTLKQDVGGDIATGILTGTVTGAGFHAMGRLGTKERPRETQPETNPEGETQLPPGPDYQAGEPPRKTTGGSATTLAESESRLSPVDQASADAQTLKSGGSVTDDTRLKNATLISVYGENAAVRHAIESPELSAVGDAMLMAAPTVERVRGTLQKGRGYRDITDDIIGAVDELAKIKENGANLTEVLAQGVNHDISYEGQLLLRFLYENQDNPKRIAAFLENYLQEVENATGVPSQVRGRAFDIIQEQRAAKEKVAIEQARQAEEKQKVAQIQTMTEQARAENTLLEIAKAKAAGSGINPEYQTVMERAFANAKKLKGKPNEKPSSGGNESVQPAAESVAQSGLATSEKPAIGAQKPVSKPPKIGNPGNPRLLHQNGGEEGAPSIAKTAEGAINRGAKISSELLKGDGSRENPVIASRPKHIAQAAERAETQPSSAQKKAGNYAKGHFKFSDDNPLSGLGVISIETAKGQERVAQDGNWAVKMPANYGHLQIAEGKDGGKADVTIGDDLKAKHVYVIDQIDPITKKFDETKSFIGFTSQKAAEAVYIKSFSDGKGKDRMGAITEMTPAQYVAKAQSNGLKDAIVYKKPKEITPSATKSISGNGLPQNGMQERAVRAVESGSPELAQEGAAGGNKNITTIPSDVQTAALKAANEEIAADNERAIQKELHDIAIGNRDGADIGALAKNQKYWDAENEQLSDAGYAEYDRQNRRIAEERADVKLARSLDDLDYAGPNAQINAMQKILDGLDIPYQRNYSYSTSRYLDIGGTDQTLKLRFSDHANTVRDTSMRPDINVAPGASTFDDALHAVLALKQELLNPQQRIAPPVAESQAPVTSELGAGGVAPTRESAVPDTQGGLAGKSSRNEPLRPLIEALLKRKGFAENRGMVDKAVEYAKDVMRGERGSEVALWLNKQAKKIIATDPATSQALSNVAMAIKATPESPLSRGAATGVGLSVTEVRTETDRIAASWANAPEFVVTEIPAQWPFQAPGDARGAYHQGKVYLASQNLSLTGPIKASPQFVIFHEALGHFGLQGMLGQDLAPVLNSVWANNKNVRVAATEWMNANRDVIQKYSMTDRQAQLRGTEEALADMAGLGKTFTGLKKVMASIQAWLRGHGLEGVANWLEGLSDAESLRLLAGARSFVEDQEMPSILRQQAGYEAFVGGNSLGMFDSRAAAQASIDGLGAPVREAHGWIVRSADGRQIAGPVPSEQAARNLVQSNSSGQPGFDITPELREKALQGMPLFARQQMSEETKARVERERQHAGENAGYTESDKAMIADLAKGQVPLSEIGEIPKNKFNQPKPAYTRAESPKEGGPYQNRGKAIAEELKSKALGVALGNGLSPEKQQQEISRGGFRAAMATLDRNIGTTAAKLEEAKKLVDTVPIPQRWLAMHEFQSGGVSAVSDQKLKPIFEAWKQNADERATKIKSWDDGYLKEVITNYFSQIWKDPKGAMDWYTRMMSKGPLEGGKNFLKQRTYASYKEGMSWKVFNDDGDIRYFDTERDARSAAGPEDMIRPPLEPISNNFVDIAQASLQQMDKFIAMHEFRQWLKEEKGWVKTVKQGDGIPDGYAKVDDPSFRSRAAYPIIDKETGKASAAIVGYDYTVPALIARDLNNYLSKGLYQFGLWKNFRYAENLQLSARLGFSGFHAGFTTMDSAVVHVDIGARRLIDGDVAGAIKAWGQGLLSPIHAAEGLFGKGPGAKLLRQFYGESANPNTRAVLDFLTQGGARGYMHPTEFNNSINSLKQAWQSGDIKGTALHALPAIIDGVMRPIMHNLVPAQKMTARVLMAKFELDRIAEKLGKQKGDYAEITKAMGQDALRQIAYRVVQQVDDRLGQMAYDNLFWNRFVKDIAQASIQSVGWNVGTANVILGGLKDIRKLFRPEQLLGPLDKAGNVHGDLGRVTGRLSYLISLNLTVGVLGAILNNLMTGEGAKDLRDYFFPRTGRKNPDGTDERISMPSYIKDEYALTKAPVATVQHKLHPFFGMVAELLKNQDFYGNQIVNSDDPWTKIAGQIAGYMGTSIKPYAISNLQQNLRRGSSPGMAAVPFIGITPAPSSVSRTAFESYIADKYSQAYHKSKTPEEAERSQARADALMAIKKGEKPDLSQFTPREISSIRRDARTPIQIQRFSKLALNEKISAFGKASEEERDQYHLRAYLAKDYALHGARLDEDERQKALNIIRGK